MFEIDFNKSLIQYKTLFFRKFHKQAERELIIEMIFQLGPKGVSKFRKMLFYLNNNQKNMTCLEMMDSLWYKQTPERVNDLIKNFRR